MNRNTDIRHRTSFQVKKWTLFAFCFIGIIGSIIMGALATKLVDIVVDETVRKESTEERDLKPGDVDTIKTMSKVFIYIGVGFVILFNLLGLLGAYKEHYCMTVSYAILMCVASVGAVVTAFKNPYYFATAAIDVFVCFIAFAFAHDLRLRRRLLFATPVVMVTSGVHPHTTVQMAPTPTTGQQYVEKEGQQYTAVAQEDEPHDDHKNKEIP